MASREQMQTASVAGKAMLKAHPTALRAHYEPKIGQVIITLNTGLQFLLDPAKTQGLQGATHAELKRIEIVGPGLGLYFPKLDVDISYRTVLLTFLPHQADRFRTKSAAASARPMSSTRG